MNETALDTETLTELVRVLAEEIIYINFIVAANFGLPKIKETLEHIQDRIADAGLIVPIEWT